MHQAEQEIQTLIRGGESLAVEFKSDVKSLPDRDLVAAVVALANTEGGDLFLGVEADWAACQSSQPRRPARTDCQQDHPFAGRAR
mgnify:CR=1 FL=1